MIQIVSLVGADPRAEIASSAVMPKSTIQDRLQDAGRDVGAARGPTMKNGSSPLNTMVGAMDDMRALPGAMDPARPGLGRRRPWPRCT